MVCNINRKKCFIYLAKGFEVFQLTLDREPQQMVLINFHYDQSLNSKVIL
jgi:hypothetical protein